MFMNGRSGIVRKGSLAALSEMTVAVHERATEITAIRPSFKALSWTAFNSKLTRTQHRS